MNISPCVVIAVNREPRHQWRHPLARPRWLLVFFGLHQRRVSSWSERIERLWTVSWSSRCFQQSLLLSLVIHKRTTLFVIGCLVDVVCEVVVVGRSMATQSTPPAFPLWVLYGFQPWAIGHQDSRHLIHWMVWLNPFTHLSKHQFGLEITHGCHHPEHLAMDFSSRYPVFFHGTPFLFPQLGQLFLVLEEVIKAHWFDAMCMAFAAYIHHCWVQSECHHPSGGFFIPFLNPFSACRFESI